MIDADTPPKRRAPPLTCDTHFHLFGPPDRYPMAPTARYAAPQATLADYLGLAEVMGIGRFVLVQPSGYGTDNTYLLECLAQLGERARAIVEIDENCPDELLEELHARGVRGVRVHTAPMTEPDAALARALVSRTQKLASRLAGLGWVIGFTGPGWLTEALLPTMASLRMNFIVDHFGLFPAAGGVEHPGFAALIRLVERGHCWVKLTSCYRISKFGPDYPDVHPMARALVDAAPERMLWGTDYPHLWFWHLSSAALFDQFTAMLPDEAVQKTILVDNPAKLFGFRG